MRDLDIFSIISDCTVLCGITLFYAEIWNLTIKLMRSSNMLYLIFDFVFGDGIKRTMHFPYFHEISFIALFLF